MLKKKMLKYHIKIYIGSRSIPFKIKNNVYIVCNITDVLDRQYKNKKHK